MRAKQATRGLERYWKVRTRLVLPSIAPPRGKNFFEGKRGRGGGGYRFFEIGATTGGG